MLVVGYRRIWGAHEDVCQETTLLKEIRSPPVLDPWYMGVTPNYY